MSSDIRHVAMSAFGFQSDKNAGVPEHPEKSFPDESKVANTIVTNEICSRYSVLDDISSSNCIEEISGVLKAPNSAFETYAKIASNPDSLLPRNLFNEVIEGAAVGRKPVAKKVCVVAQVTPDAQTSDVFDKRLEKEFSFSSDFCFVNQEQEQKQQQPHLKRFKTNDMASQIGHSNSMNGLKSFPYVPIHNMNHSRAEAIRALKMAQMPTNHAYESINTSKMHHKIFIPINNANAHTLTNVNVNARTKFQDAAAAAAATVTSDTITYSSSDYLSRDCENSIGRKRSRSKERDSLSSNTNKYFESCIIECDQMPNKFVCNDPHSE